MHPIIENSSASPRYACYSAPCDRWGEIDLLTDSQVGMVRRHGGAHRAVVFLKDLSLGCFTFCSSAMAPRGDESCITSKDFNIVVDFEKLLSR